MHRARTLVASASVSCATALAVAWPAVTRATDPEPPTAEATIDPNAAQVGPVLATSELVPHPKFKGMYELAVTLKNPSADAPCEARLETVVWAQAFSEDSRGGPMPETAWRKQETVRLEPGQVIAKRQLLPAELSFRISQSRARAERAERDGAPTMRGVYYYAGVQEPAPSPNARRGS